MESKINPKSFTFPINEKMMKSQINPASFTFPINQKMMKSTINQKVMMPFLQMKEGDIMDESSRDAVVPNTENLAPKPLQPFQLHCHSLRAITGKCPHGQTINCVSCLQSTLDAMVNRVEDGEIIYAK